MNCQYCNSECNKTYSKDNSYVYHCESCDVKFYVLSDKNVVGIEIFHQMKELMYSVRFLFKTKKSEVYFLAKVLNEDGSHFKNKYFKQVIHTFDYILDVTPSNIEKKLETILTFL